MSLVVAQMPEMSTVDALRALKQGGLSEARHIAGSDVPRKTELLSAWLVDRWSADPATIGNPAYHDLLQPATILPPVVLAHLFSHREVAQPVLDSLAAANYNTSSIAAESWAGVLEAMLGWIVERTDLYGWEGVMSIVWNQAQSLSEDVVSCKKLQAMNPVTVSRALGSPTATIWRRRLSLCLFPASMLGTCPSGRLAALYVEALYLQRHEAFTQPTSSRVNYERFVRDRFYERLAEPVIKALDGFGNDWQAYRDLWQALALAGYEPRWEPLVKLTEARLKEALDMGEEGAWPVVGVIDAPLASLVDPAVKCCHNPFAQTFLARTIMRGDERDINKIIQARRPELIPFLMSTDLVEAFRVRLSGHDRLDELDYITRVWAALGKPVAIESLSADLWPDNVNRSAGLMALLRLHTLNGIRMEHDEAIVDGLAGMPEDQASLAITYITRCTEIDISDHVLDRLREGQCAEVITERLLHRWQQIASPENCLKLPIPHDLGATKWELDKFVAHSASKVEDIVDILAHAKCTVNLGSQLIKAAIKDPQWSRYVGLAEKHDVPMADIAKAAFSREDAALAAIVKVDEGVEKVCCKLAKKALSPVQVLVMAKTVGSNDVIARALVTQLQGNAPELCRAAAYLTDALGPVTAAETVVHSYLKSADIVDVETTRAIARVVKTLEPALVLMAKSAEPAEAIPHFDNDVYAQLWLIEPLVPHLIRCPRAGSGKLVAAQLSELLRQPTWPIIEAVVSFRSAVLNTDHFDAICAFAASRSGRIGVSMVIDLCRQRPDLVSPCATALSMTLTAALEVACTDNTIASLVSKLIVLVVDRKATGFANHAPAILLAYVRRMCLTLVPAAVRLELEPGIFALCEAASRGRDRDRHGEGYLGIGVGEGGEAEAELWARLWTSFRKKRYTGRG